MGKSVCPHCGNKVVIRHTLIKSDWYDGRGKNPSSTSPTFNHEEMYQAYLDGVPKTMLVERYGVSKRRIDAVIREQKEKKP